MSKDEKLVVVMPLETDADRDLAFRLAMSMYLGEACKYCGKVYETLDDLKTVVYAGYHERGRCACKACWDANNPPNLAERKTK